MQVLSHIAHYPLLSADNTLIAFYNLENFFDIYDNPFKNDDLFLPDAPKQWTKERYYTKLNHISEAINLLNDYGTPAIIGLTEVENKEVLNDLVSHSKLQHVYGFVHHHSADARGIDVALLYNMRYFKLKAHKKLPIQFPEKPHFKSRDILYVKGEFANEDEVHIFVNHWPARREGIKKTKAYRMAAAHTLMKACRKIWVQKPMAKIILMGDFNDEATDDSISIGLSAKTRKHLRQHDFYNLSWLPYKMRKGSSIFNNQWLLFDQILVSKGLKEAQTGICITEDRQQILNKKQIMIYDKNIHDYIPWRTYETNDKYIGGYSDHLPIFVQLSSAKKINHNNNNND